MTLRALRLPEPPFKDRPRSCACRDSRIVARGRTGPGTGRLVDPGCASDRRRRTTLSRLWRPTDLPEFPPHPPAATATLLRTPRESVPSFLKHTASQPAPGPRGDYSTHSATLRYDTHRTDTQRCTVQFINNAHTAHGKSPSTGPGLLEQKIRTRLGKPREFLIHWCYLLNCGINPMTESKCR